MHCVSVSVNYVQHYIFPKLHALSVHHKIQKHQVVLLLWLIAVNLNVHNHNRN